MFSFAHTTHNQSYDLKIDIVKVLVSSLATWIGIKNHHGIGCHFRMCVIQLGYYILRA